MRKIKKDSITAGNLVRAGFIGLAATLLSGCYTLAQKPLAPEDEIALRTQLKQAKAIAETSLEVSKESDDYARQALDTANQAVATANKALQAANEAIAAANAAKDFAAKETSKAIDAANQASEKASQAAKEAAQAAEKAATEAMAYAEKAAKNATDAANNAISKANEAINKANELSEKAIAMTNQLMAEINRERATRRMAPPEEPILPEQPAVKEKRTYRVKPGDTLSRIADRVYHDPGKWKEIYQANRKSLKNPDHLVAGMELVLP